MQRTMSSGMFTLMSLMRHVPTFLIKCMGALLGAVKKVTYDVFASTSTVPAALTAARTAHLDLLFNIASGLADLGV